MASAALVAALLDALPQTQCTRCGYDDCRAYAEAIAERGEAINRCPPGGGEGIARLAALTGRPPLPLDPARGSETPRTRAVVDEAWCIGCALCLKACPVDAIVGAAKRMHVVVEEFCTGCELCLPACPVDCISLVDASGGRTGWSAWSASQADVARARHAAHQRRLLEVDAAAPPTAALPPETVRPAGPPAASRSQTIAAALAAARARDPRRR